MRFVISWVQISDQMS